MCDCRKIVNVKINGKVTEIKEIETAENSVHFVSFDEAEKSYPLGPGIYCIGASGVGQYYYDGNSWYSDYSYYNQCNQCNNSNIYKIEMCEFNVN